MILPRFFFCHILLISLFCFSGGFLYSQERTVDTSSYLPYYYRDAVNYNLMIAAAEGYDSEIDRLISKGADINAVNIEGASPLFFAVVRNHLSTVLKLLSYDSDTDIKTSYGETPLHAAVGNRNLEIAEALIRAGADIDITESNGATPLHYASAYGDFYATDMLLYYRAEYDKKTKDGTTPLMAAILANYADIADLLIQHGANMEARDKDGFTPFLIASQNGDTVLMNFLMSRGVDIYAKNNYSYDALALAISTDQLPAVQLLLNKGDKWSSSEMRGINPYHVAAAYGRKDIFSVLGQNDLPGRSGLRFNELIVAPSARVTPRDFFSGISLSFREPLLKSGIIIGLDSKLWHTRVLVKENEDLYYQYMDKGSMVYAGLFKDFALTDNTYSTFLNLTASLSAAYTFGNKLKGTGIIPENKFQIVPALTLKVLLKSFAVSGGVEYLKSDYFRIGPLWLRAGCSYTFYFNKVKAPLKTIKW